MTPAAGDTGGRSHRPTRPGVRVFCRVVDNFGDAGIAWRLARQLAREHALGVTLIIDAPEVLVRLVPTRDALRLRTALTDPRNMSGTVRIAGVDIGRWPGAMRHAPRMVIAAFGCELPPEVRARMTPDASKPVPLWVSLEYLSAEPWVGDVHAMASVKPADGAVEWFAMPGFDERTAGLLRERDLRSRRDAFQRTPRPQRWLSALGVPRCAGATRLSLFCYPHAPVQALLEQAAQGAEPTQLLVPEGVADAALIQMLGRNPIPGEVIDQGSLQLVRLRWLTQDEYDRLLWSCDLNFVRGEDSWIRAIWSGVPFVWQPYWQQDDAHRIKLDAFLARLLAHAAPADAHHVRAAHHAWLGDSQGSPAEQARTRAPAARPASAQPTRALTALWRDALAMTRSASLRTHLQRFADDLCRHPDLAATLAGWLRQPPAR